MPAGVPDALDLVEIRWRSRVQPIDERLEPSRTGSIFCLELAKRCFGTAQDEFGERRRISAKPHAKRLECGCESGRFGDRVSRMRGRHAASVAPYSTTTPGASPGVGMQSLACLAFTNLGGKVKACHATGIYRAGELEGLRDERER